MLPRLLALLALGSAIGSVARADAPTNEPVRDDIVELRKNRTPLAQRVLGWTADNRLVVHVAACGETEGPPACSIALEIIGDAAQKWIPLLDPESVCDMAAGGCAWKITTDAAMRAIRAERAALAELGPLTPSSATQAKDVRVESTPCFVKVLAGDRLIETPVHLDEASCASSGGYDSVKAASIGRTLVSPDGTHVGAAVRITTKWMEWSSEGESFVVVAR